MRLFCGLEAEGRHRGKRTLFVEGRVHSQTIIDKGIVQGRMLSDERLPLEYEQVYFGATFTGHPAKQVLKPNLVPMCEQDTLEAVEAVVNYNAAGVFIVTIETHQQQRNRTKVPLEFLLKHPLVELMIPLAHIDHDMHELALLTRMLEHSSPLRSRIQLRVETLQGCMVFLGEQATLNTKGAYNNDQAICSNK